MRRPGFFSGGSAAGYVPPAAPPAPITVEFAWVGNVSATGATVKVRSADATAVTLRYATNSGLTGYATVTGSEGSDEVWTCTLTGLTAATQYYFGFSGSSVTGQFRTFPTEGSVYSFVMAAASCSGDAPQYAGSTSNVSNTPAYDRIREHDPLFFLHMGDLHYRNLNTSNVASYRTAYQNVLACARFETLVRQVPTAYMWDDHDYGPNDSGGSYANKATARQAYTEYVPHWPLTGSGAIYQTFVVGRVRFIMLDCRYERSSNSATDNSSKTRLGTVQKQWLKDTLDAATEPVIVLDVQSWIGNTTSFPDGWESFSTERTELFDFFVANGHLDRLFLIGGDIHELIKDDGTNTNFETGASTAGPPYAGFAPLDATFNDFSATAQNRYQVRRQQYGTLEFTDSGSDITVTARGYALSASPGSTSSLQFTLAKTFTG